MERTPTHFSIMIGLWLNFCTLVHSFTEVKASMGFIILSDEVVRLIDAILTIPR